MGAAITVTVSWTDDGGTAESLTSEATDPVENVNNNPSGSVTITGTATQGQTLTADTSDVSDPDGPATLTFSYQWKRGGADITGATAATYVPVQDDVGAAITVTVSWTDAFNTDESLTSAATAAVANINDAPTGEVTIDGTATQGETLTANTSGVADPDGLGSFSYQWARDGAVISGATGSTYVLTQDDVGAAITVTVSWTDVGNTAESLTSEATDAVANVNDAPTGAVTITGTATQGETLTANTSGIADADGLGTFAYQWKRNNVAITSATGATYVLTQADVDAAITVTVSWTDDGGQAESLTSAATAAVANINDAPTGAVTISGTATQGETLTANTSGIADPDGLGTFSYQWKRDGSDIGGATGSTYELVQADVGATITVTVSWTDDGNTEESLTSEATAAVTNENDAPSGSVTITGTATQGQTLTAVTDTIADPDGPATLTFSYQWKRGGADIPGATGSTYVLTQADVGAAITVTVSWTDGGNTVESLTSTATAEVGNINDEPTGTVTISGTATQGETLTANTSGIADADGLGTFSYQWKRDNVAITSATGATYVLTQADVGAAITVTVSWTDGGNTVESLTSAPTNAVANVNDEPTGSVTITGTARQGQTLTANTSGIADADGLGTFSYQWERDGAVISGATGSTYVLTQADVGAEIAVTVSWTDDGNTAESLTSEATDAVANVNDAPTGAVTITGTATQGETLTANTSGIADADGLGTFSYQWKRDGTNIPGATGATYVLVQADVGAAITVTVSWTDGGGAAESLTSDATAAVANVNDAPTGSVTITGTAAQGRTLRADTSGIADPDGPAALTFSYQWKRDGADITGATGATYMLTQADVGARITVTASWTDAGNTAESLTSTATTAVRNVNEAPTGAVTITGTATQGRTLTADTSDIADADGLGTFSYQWHRDGADITGATGATYMLTQADVGTRITVTASWTDAGNTAESLTSAPTAAVANVNDPPTGAVTITGTAMQGRTLTADTSGIADPDGPATLTFRYQWKRDGADITGATGATYALVQADVGARIAVTASWTDAGSTAESLTSTATAAVANVNDAPTGAVTITGTATQGETLTANTSTIADPDGPGTLTFSYQWKRDGTDIPGATGATYTLVEADVGTTITVTVSWTDAGATAESLTSDKTVAVMRADPPVTAVIGADPGTTPTVDGDEISATIGGTEVKLTLPAGHGVSTVTFSAPTSGLPAAPAGVSFGAGAYVGIELDATLMAAASVCLASPGGPPEILALYHLPDGGWEWATPDSRDGTPESFVCGETADFSTFVVGRLLPTALAVFPERDTIDEAAGKLAVRAMLDRPAPSGGVTVTLTAAGTATDDDYALPEAFTIAENETARTVDITIVDDDIDDDGETIELSATTDPAGFAVTGRTVTITDDDARGITTSPAELTVAEGDETGATYTVALASEPTAEVTVAIAGDDADVEVSPPSLVFTTDNWDRPRKVTVRAAPDEDTEDETAELTHTASGGDYDGETAAVAVTVIDNDGALLRQRLKGSERGRSPGTGARVRGKRGGGGGGPLRGGAPGRRGGERRRSGRSRGRALFRRRGLEGQRAGAGGRRSVLAPGAVGQVVRAAAGGQRRRRRRGRCHGLGRRRLAASVARRRRRGRVGRRRVRRASRRRRRSRSGSAGRRGGVAVRERGRLRRPERRGAGRGRARQPHDQRASLSRPDLRRRLAPVGDGGIRRGRDRDRRRGGGPADGRHEAGDRGGGRRRTPGIARRDDAEAEGRGADGVVEGRRQ